MKMEYLKDVVSLRLDRDACIGCGRCLEVCPHGVFVLVESKSRIAFRDACMECGACARNCPVDALKVKNGVGCAVGILNSALGRTSKCCGESQSPCCDEAEMESPSDKLLTKKERMFMDEKTKELIAVGASIGAHCQPCLTFHVAKAKELGINENEIREAIAIGHMVEKGAMSAMKEFSAGVFDAPSGKGTDCCADGKNKSKGCCS